LITVVGEDTYALMCDLCSPKLPEDETYDDLVKLITEHLEPQRSEIAERHVFRLRRQQIGEPLTVYLQALKHLASTCNFGKCQSCSTLEENLRDQFVSGLTSDAMRSRIFAEKKIEYKEAVELALALEAAEKHAETSASTAAVAMTIGQSTGGEPAETLHFAQGARGGSRGRAGRTPRHSGGGAGAGRARHALADAARSCWRCGRPHGADRCRFKNYNCDECGLRGHLKAMCKQVRSDGVRHNFVSEESDDGMFNIAVAARGNKPYYIKLLIDGISIDCEVDTGSRISAISEEMFRQLFSHKKIEADNLILRCYSGTRITSLGYMEVDVGLGNVLAQCLRLYIIKDGARPLLGRDWMRALKINQINLHEIIDDGFVTKLCKEFPEVLCDKLGV
jgi:hypothetical protein